MREGSEDSPVVQEEGLSSAVQTISSSKPKGLFGTHRHPKARFSAKTTCQPEVYPLPRAAEVTEAYGRVFLKVGPPKDDFLWFPFNSTNTGVPSRKRHPPQICTACVCVCACKRPHSHRSSGFPGSCVSFLLKVLPKRKAVQLAASSQW